MAVDVRIWINYTIRDFWSQLGLKMGSPFSCHGHVRAAA